MGFARAVPKAEFFRKLFSRVAKPLYFCDSEPGLQPARDLLFSAFRSLPSECEWQSKKRPLVTKSAALNSFHTPGSILYKTSDGENAS